MINSRNAQTGNSTFGLALLGLLATLTMANAYSNDYQAMIEMTVPTGTVFRAAKQLEFGTPLAVSEHQDAEECNFLIQPGHPYNENTPVKLSVHCQSPDADVSYEFDYSQTFMLALPTAKQTGISCHVAVDQQISFNGEQLQFCIGFAELSEPKGS
ncbi:hypothetical protein [Aliagarivorans taiwanensis]|uniref:hypothetical protein n=1 Tax=Aliagarivorans taiwanensis TaxID=561966 RepID=UPI0003FDABBC|nr:hypothetical protein [Aliagarivorans taiwanensis]